MHQEIRKEIRKEKVGFSAFHTIIRIRTRNSRKRKSVNPWIHAKQSEAISASAKRISHKQNVVGVCASLCELANSLKLKLKLTLKLQKKGFPIITFFSWSWYWFPLIFHQKHHIYTSYICYIGSFYLRIWYFSLIFMMLFVVLRLKAVLHSFQMDASCFFLVDVDIWFEMLRFLTNFYRASFVRVCAKRSESAPQKHACEANLHRSILCE